MNKSSINSKIEVSIIIVNYNTGKLLEKCIASIVKNTNSLKYPHCEIIIVDNNSTDGSADFKGPFKLINNKDNPGFSKANNQGIRLAKGEYILLLNPDTEIKGDALAKLLEFAKEKEGVGVVVPQLLNVNGSVQDSLMPFPTTLRAIAEFWFGRKVYSKYAPKFTVPTEVEGAIMASFLITPEARKKVGLLNEKYFMYFEDLDYCREVQEKGLKIYYVPGAKVLHYEGVSGRRVASSPNQWKRLIPGSKLYHGQLKHYLLFLIMWLGQKLFK